MILCVSSGDVIGLTEEKSCFFPETSITQSLNKVDPMHGSLSGNPFHSDQSSRYVENSHNANRYLEWFKTEE